MWLKKEVKAKAQVPGSIPGLGSKIKPKGIPPAAMQIQLQSDDPHELCGSRDALHHFVYRDLTHGRMHFCFKQIAQRNSRIALHHILLYLIVEMNDFE